MRTSPRHALRALPCLLLLLACDPQPGNEPAAPGPGGEVRADAGAPLQEAGAAQPLDPGTSVQPAPNPAAEQAFQALRARVEQTQALDAAGLRAAYPVAFRPALGYDPNAAEFMDRIQASALALSDAERSALGKNGFVVSTRREFPTFLRGLAEIYSEHLPLYVTADSLLEAVHSSYDAILKKLELELLVPELHALLRGMRGRLAGAHAEAQAIEDTDFYLSVAIALLEDAPAAPVTKLAPARVQAIVDLAKAASGIANVELFKVKRMEDFSQFVPRGHYADDEQLQRYFRAMMWLGRIDFRLLETQSDGKQVFRREQYLATLLMHELVAPDRARFDRIDAAIRTFVGESDYMVLSEVPELEAALGGPEAARAASDQAVVAAIVAGGYGEQQIASHLIVVGAEVPGGLPLNRSFALLGQRYIVDSHVFSQVVYDRLPQRRMMPTPLDAAFAALGNAQALGVHPDLDAFPSLPGALGRMRVLIDAHDQAFWDASLYNLWMSALRALSPAADLSDPAARGLPELTGTEAWGRRLLNAQLGSWAELRHDTLLYAKQSYTGIPGCEYPDAYVDPYPAFYRALGKYAAAGARVVELIAEVKPELSASVGAYFAALSKATSVLGDMAERQLRGEPFSAEQLAFINEAVRVEQQSAGCTTVLVPDGWYARLFFDPEKSIEFDPTIADVHTQPADEVGNIVGKVLHVGTGYPRMMVTTVDTCQGPRAYAGVVFAYHEETTKGFQRLTDEAWAQRLRDPATPRPADVAWMSSILAK